jgi:hypothetical protein
MILFLIDYIFLVIMIIVYFDYISSKVRLYLYQEQLDYIYVQAHVRIALILVIRG